MRKESPMNAEKIIQYIAESEKKTPVKVYIKGNLKELDFPDNIQTFVNATTGVLFGEWKEVSSFLQANERNVEDMVIENDRRHSAIPLLDIKDLQARIEPGAIIREQVEIGENAIIMMGAIINVGAVIGNNTMIDMGAVLGGRAMVGSNCHIGAGSVLAGVVEPSSASPVIIDDDVLIGANAVVIEGVRVGKGAVIAAGAVVISNVDAYTMVAGTPAKVIKKIDEKTKSKTELIDALRQL